ncbi:MAG: hypothetical protein FWE71_01260 [Nocardioidaceae bacterium]|nr:hypothetical protein [Nocardioidaceae bacterium]MCL2613333.1 hypothetical protein [Nocardioidaceae bacterium]
MNDDRHNRIRLIEALRPHSGSETAVWTGALVFVLALAVAALLVTFGGSGTERPQPPETIAVAAGGSPRPATERLDRQGVWDPYVAVVGGGHGGTEGAERQWRPVVRGFVSDFLRASTDSAWLTKVRPLVTPELLTRLRWVVRSGIPSGTIGSVALQQAGSNTADVTVTYTSGGAKRALGVRVVDLPNDGHGWMVYSYEDRTPAS